MQKKTFILLVLFLWSTRFFAQSPFFDSIPNSFNIKTNPFAMLQGPIMFTSEYRIGIEKPVSLFSTIQVSGSFLGKAFYVNFMEAVNDMNDALLINGYRFQAEYKYYFLGKKREQYPFSGFYFSINGSYSQAKITTAYYKFHDEYISAVYEYAALKAGYQYCYKRYTFDIFYGMGIREVLWKSNIPQQNQNLDKKKFIPFNTPLKILLGINIGIRI